MSQIIFLTAEERAAIIDLLCERMPGRRFTIVTSFNEGEHEDALSRSGEVAPVWNSEFDVFGTMDPETARHSAQVMMDVADAGSIVRGKATPKGNMHFGDG